MSIEKRFDTNKKAWVIRPTGYLDLFNLPQVKEAFAGTEGCDILFCCEELRYLDAAVIRLMAEVAAKANAEGHVFRVNSIKSYIYKIIEMVGMQHMFVFTAEEEGQA